MSVDMREIKNNQNRHLYEKVILRNYNIKWTENAQR